VSKTRWTCQPGSLRCAMQTYWENGAPSHRPTPALCADLVSRGVQLDCWEGESDEVQSAVLASWDAA
jgi:hypothetical protein